MRTLNRKGRIEIKLIDEAIELIYSAMQDIFSQFQKVGEIPILEIGHGRKSRLEMVKTPFEITDENHPIYHLPETGISHLYDFKKPELVAELAQRRWVEIYHRPDGSVSRYPMDYPAGGWSNIGGYHILLHDDPSMNYLIAGEENCVKQLEVWGRDYESIDELFEDLFYEAP